MIRLPIYFSLVLCVLFFAANCQEYDFAAEISRQCLVPDPVGLLDCVENKVTLPYLTSWVDCTNSLGQNVRTSADIINYRCKSVWEGKGVIPEVFYIKDCVIEKTALPAKNVSAEVLGAYKECESTPSVPQQRIKTAPVQQQQLRVSSVEYKPPSPQIQVPVVQPPQQAIQVQTPIQQIQAPVFQQSQPQFQVQRPVQQVQFQPQQQFQVQRPVQQVQFQPQQQFQVQRPVQQVQFQPQQQFQVQRPIQQVQVQPQQPFQMQIPFQQTQTAFMQPLQQAQIPFQQSQAPASFQISNIASQQQFGSRVQKPFQPQQIPIMQQRPVQQQISVAAPNPIQPAPFRSFAANQQTHTKPAPLNQQHTAAFKPQYPSPASKPQYPTSINPTVQRQPYSQQFFAIHPQAPLPNQQQNINRATLSQKTVPNQPFVSQQLVAANTQDSSVILNAPYSYSFQIHHPLQLTS